MNNGVPAEIKLLLSGVSVVRRTMAPRVYSSLHVCVFVCDSRSESAHMDA